MDKFQKFEEISQDRLDREESRKKVPKSPVECCKCGGLMDSRDIEQYTVINGDVVCNDCLQDYCCENYENYIVNYVSGGRLQREEFGELLFRRLLPSEKFKIARSALETDLTGKHAVLDLCGVAKEAALDYCLAHLADFSEFVKENYAQ